MKASNLVGLARLHFQKFVKFLIVGIVGSILTLITAYIFTEYFGFWYIYSAIVGMIVGAVNNYLLNFYWVFKRKE